MYEPQRNRSYRTKKLNNNVRGIILLCIRPMCTLYVYIIIGLDNLIARPVKSNARSAEAFNQANLTN